MRRTVAALVAAVIVGLAFSLAACSGGGSTSGTEASGSAPATVAVVSITDMKLPEDTLSPTVTVAADQKSQPYQWPFGKKETPSDIQTNLDAGQPMMIVYLDSAQVVTRDQRAEISAVMDKYRGLIDLMTFDIVQAMPSSDAATSADIEKTADIAQALGVTSTPYFVFVDRYGRITWRFNGFVDRGLLEREVLRATQ